jgi:hypothetical protein
MEVRPVKIRYIGPAAEGVNLSPEAGGLYFPHGAPVEVDDDLARSLLDQGTFTKAEAPKPKARGSAARSNLDVESR